VRPPPVATNDLLCGVPCPASQGGYRSDRALATSAQGLLGSLAVTDVAALCLAAMTLGQGCTVECRGPGCEGAYPDGRVDLLGDLPLDGQEVLIDDVARGAIVGSVVSGSAFSTAAFPGGLVVGQPEARSVRQFSLPEGAVADEGAEVLWASNDDDFGHAIAILPAPDGSSWSMVVAAPGADRDRGVLHIYADASGGTVEPSLSLQGASQGDRLGERLRLCPDRTGDGLPELLVSAPWMQDVPELDAFDPAGDRPAVEPLAGAVMLIDSDDLLATTVGDTRSILEVATVWWGEDAGHSLGVGLDCHTDLDGDGLFDLVLGAPQFNESAGKIYLVLSGQGFLGGPIGARVRPTLEGGPAEMLGESVATFERPDEGGQLLVGAPGHDGGRGAAIWLDASDLTGVGLQTRTRINNDKTTTDHVGRTVAVAELDGDGLPDLLVGGPDRRVGQLYDVGQIGVFLGSRALGDTEQLGDADLSITDDQGFRRVGRHIVSHDVDDDGIDELLLPTRSPRSR